MISKYYYRMLLYVLITLSVGVEAGYNFPAVGFDNLNSGPVLNMFVSRDFGVADLALSLKTDFYHGRNNAYSVNFYGIRVHTFKSTWRFSPVIEFGTDYMMRTLNAGKESGYVFTYGVGLVINFTVDRLRIYPKLCYDGVTDFKKHAGFLGTKIGIAYDI
jgi:hypothetical protein